MYQSTFGFQSRPFSATPRHDWYWETDSLKQIYQSLAGCIERAAGPAMLIGAPGTGKTIMCQVVAEKLRSMFSVVVLDSARLCTRRAFLQSILFELGLPYRDLEEGELRLTLVDYLNPSDECPNGMLLVIDEAHVLPIRLLEELHMITNLVRDGQPRVRLMLAGNRTLEERFTHPQLESFHQRIAVRSYLKGLNQEETSNYIAFQLNMAGGAKATEMIPADTCKVIHDLTQGLPRVINQVCDHSLLLAAADGVKTISPKMVSESWADIQQLPVPWFASHETPDSQESIIEFGELDEFDTESVVPDVPVNLQSIADTADETSHDETSQDENSEFSSEHDETVNDPAESALRQSLSSEDPIESLEGISDAVNDAAQSQEPEAVDSSIDHDFDVEDLQDDGADGAEAESPASDLDPEFTFETPANPFAEEFEEEERVADPFATDAPTEEQHRDPKDVQEPGQLDPDDSGSPRPVQVQVERSPAVDVTFDKETGRSTISLVKPETKIFVPAEQELTEEAKQGDTQRVKTTPSTAGDDDRDIIVLTRKCEIVDSVDSTLGTEQSKVHRQEYQTLFARLRNGILRKG